jgi:hypothetical protein
MHGLQAHLFPGYELRVCKKIILQLSLSADVLVHKEKFYVLLVHCIHTLTNQPPPWAFFNFRLGPSSCAVVARLGDILYHMSMVFGNAVLLDRVATVVPVHLTKRFTIAHIVILLVRFAIGIVDTAIITVSAASNGSCIYVDNIAVSDFFFGFFCSSIRVAHKFVNVVGTCVHVLRYVY